MEEVTATDKKYCVSDFGGAYPCKCRGIDAELADDALGYLSVVAEDFDCGFREIAAYVDRALRFLEDPALERDSYGYGWLAVADIGIALGLNAYDEDAEDGIFSYTAEPDDPATRRIIDAIDKALYFLSGVATDFVEVEDDDAELLHYREVLGGAWKEVAKIGPALGLDKPGARPVAPVPYGVFLSL